MRAEELSAGELLAALARGAIGERLGLPAQPLAELPTWLAERGAVFVTLHERGELRGCIGTLMPHRSLLEDLVANACAAAFGDPRFPPLAREELAEVEIEVSQLGSLEPLPPLEEHEARAVLRPRRDGVVLEYRGRRGTFLPQVWDQLTVPADFLRQLKRKAGLAPDFWANDLRLSRYEVTEHHESPSRPAVVPDRTPRVGSQEPWHLSRHLSR